MIKKRRVLVVYKKDAYQQYIQEQQDPHLLRLLNRSHPDVQDMQKAHVVHEEALEAIVLALRKLPVEFDLAFRADIRVTKRYDLVVSVGGDGTFLQAARSIADTPILGVNSDPARSEAVFCAANQRTFPGLCRKALEGKLSQLRLYRLKLVLNGQELPQRAINDVLIAHDDPATMSRYRLSIGTRRELQKSSGLWIATAQGSSSAVWAAGGKRLSWAARRYQYRPRELYTGRLTANRLVGGLLSASQKVRIGWLMRRGCAFVDGPHLKIPLRFADELVISLSLSDPLRALGLPAVRVP